MFDRLVLSWQSLQKQRKKGRADGLNRLGGSGTEISSVS